MNIDVITTNYNSLEEQLETILKKYPRIKSRKIFIKPNLGGRDPITKGENNDYQFILKLCKVLCKLQATEIAIGHSSLIGFGYSKNCGYDDLIKVNRYDKLLKLKNVKLLNLDNVNRRESALNGYSFNVPTILQEDEYFYIDLAKMKTHMETGVSMALKNQMGLVNFNDRKNMHKKELHRQIATLAKIITPDLIIIDGIIGMEGNGPHHGTDIKANLVIIASNLVEADSLGCYLMGIDAESIDHIVIARDLRVGEFVCRSIKIKYLNKKKIFEPAKNNYKKGRSFYVWPTTSCSGCIFSLSRAFDKYVKKHPIKALKKILLENNNVFIGASHDIDPSNCKNVYAIGSCCEEMAIKHKINKYLKGCPPLIDDIVRLLEDKK